MEKTPCNKDLNRFNTCQEMKCEHWRNCLSKWVEEIYLALDYKNAIKTSNPTDKKQYRDSTSKEV